MTTHYKQRDDALWIGGGHPSHGPRRQYVPTDLKTKWVESVEEVLAVGGGMHFNEDQTEIVLTLPAGFKFSIQFERRNGK